MDKVVMFERSEFAAALQLVGRVKPWQREIQRFDKVGKPIQSVFAPGVVRIDVVGGTASLSSSSFDATIRSAIDCRGNGEDFTMFVPLAPLTTATDKAPAGAQISLGTDGERVAFKAGRFSAAYHALPQDACADMPAPEGVTATLRAEAARAGIASCEPAVLDDAKRAFLGGVYIHDVAGGLGFAGRDDNRLHLREIGEGELGGSAILPRSAARLLLSVMPDTGTITATLGQRGATFAWGRTELRTRLIDAQYPMIDRARMPSHDRLLRAHAHELLADIDLVATVTDLKRRDVRFDLGEKCTASATRQNHDTGEVDLIVEYDGAPLTINFQIALLVDALSLFGEHPIEWRLGSMYDTTVISSPAIPGLETMVAPILPANAPRMAVAA